MAGSRKNATAVLSVVCIALLPAQIQAVDPQVERAIDAGSKYLQQLHQPNPAYRGGSHGAGTASLVGLALLESGVPADNPSLKNIVYFVRTVGLAQTKTYETSLVVIFLDRLGDRIDRPMIQFLTMRIMAGQTPTGRWSYDCGNPISDAEIVRLRKAFYEESQLRSEGDKKSSPDGGRGDIPFDPSKGKSPDRSKPSGGSNDDQLHPEVSRFARSVNGARSNTNPDGDNSNTQFALLALWIARKHAVSTDNALSLGEKRFRVTQERDGGWPYVQRVVLPPFAPMGQSDSASSATMTCAGLLAIATGQGAQMHALRTKSSSQGSGGTKGGDTSDRAAAAAIRFLEESIANPAPQNQAPPSPFSGPVHARGNLHTNLYFLWSLERVAMIFDLDKIGKIEWYKWGVDNLIKLQAQDGSWPTSNYEGANAEINTAFALLFLNRANLAKDLTATLRGKASGDVKLPTRITDPEPVKVEPKQAPKVTGEFDSEANRIANTLISASASSRAGILTQMRDTKGSVYTEALARAIPKLQGEAQREAREALAMRLKRMTANTLRDMLKDESLEIRCASATACGLKEDRQFVADLIGLVADNESLVVQSARTSLQRLTAKDFGPPPEATAPEKARAAAAWQTWWNGQPK